MKSILFYITILFVNISFASTTDDAWKLEKNKDGIKVWNRKTPNSSLKEYKASIILNTTPEKLVALIKNVNLYDKWMYKVDAGSVKVLKKISDNDYYTYMTISAPLVKSRESITHMVFNSPDNTGSILITLDGAPSLLPKNDKYVRIEKSKGYFKIVPLANGTVELIHQAYGAPGGAVPDFLANLTSVDCPFYMLSKLKEFLY